MSASASSSVAVAAAASGLPVKRHRNTFLLPLQQQDQEQNRLPVAEEDANSAPPQQQCSNDSSSEDSNNDDGQAAATAAAENDRLDARPLALVILNTQGEGESEGLLRHLWGRADLRVCADGGANRLHDSFGGGGGDVEDRHQDRARFVPDIIVGDLDSLRPEVARFYEGLGSEIKLRDDEDHCDFEKCLLEVESRLSSPVPSPEAGGSGGSGGGSGGGGSAPCGATVVGLGAFGGRFDHEMQAVSLLHAYTSRFHRLVLMGAGNVAFLLQPGLSHAVQPDSRFEGPTVGLLPVGGPCLAVTTEGLRWNLDGRGLEFGVCVSSSNHVVGDVVRVVTDAPLVWTAEFKTAAWMEVVSFAGGG
ncbi:unnamed protein product [Ectocarpus sp. 12 AP-2014]